MNIVIRKFRRWKHAKRCGLCHRKYMFIHKKCGNPILPEGLKIERKLKPDECCGQCTDIDKEKANV